MDTRRLDRNSHELRPRVRRRLIEAREALADLATTQEEYLESSRKPKVDEWSSFNRQTRRPTMKTYDLEDVQAAFESLDGKLKAHFKNEESSFYPALRKAIRASEVASVTGLVQHEKESHVELLAEGSRLRSATVFVPPLRTAMNGLLQHLEQQIQYEETRVFAELLDGSVAPEETPIPNRYRTSDDVARALRRAAPERPPEPEPEKGLISSLFKKWLGNGER